MVANSSVVNSDSIYILTKSHKMVNYTLCEMRSWVTPLCSTEFRSSGTAGTSMTAWCEDAQDTNAYHRSFPQGFGDWPGPAKDWKVSSISRAHTHKSPTQGSGRAKDGC